MPYTIGRHLKTVLKQRNAPTGKNGYPQRCLLMFQMSVPGKGHKQVADR